MKKSRILSLLAAAALAVTSLGAGFSAAAVEVAPDTTHEVKVTKSADDKLEHTYEAYQIFSGTLTGTDHTDAVITYVTWGDGIDKTKLAVAVDGADSIVTDALAAYNAAQTDDADKLVTPYSADEDAEKFADFINSNSSTPGFAEAIADMFNAALKATPTKDVVVSAGETEGTLTGLPTGYYIIKDKDNSLTGDPNQAAYTDYMLTIVKVETDLEIAAKSDVPTISKVIDPSNASPKANTAAIGDEIPYKLTTKVPAMTGYNKYFFVVNDKMDDGLTFNKNSVEITLGGKTLTAGTDFYVKTADGTGREELTDTSKTFEIVFTDFIQYQPYNGDAYKKSATGTYYKLKDGTFTTTASTDETEILYTSTTQKYEKLSGTDIEITYKATLNEKADRTDHGNENTVDLTFSNNPNFDYSGKPGDESDEPGDDEPSGVTPKDKVKTFTTGICIVKVDQDGNRLSGVTFTLQASDKAMNKVLVFKDTFEEAEDGTYYKLKNGTYTDKVVAGKEDLYVSTETKYKKKTRAEVQESDLISDVTPLTVEVDESGYAAIAGLNEGTFILTETAAPEGYNKKAPVYIKIKQNIDTTATTADSIIPQWQIGQGETAAEAEAKLGDTGYLADEDNAIVEVVVENKKGIILPTTGGIGTLIFYLVGSLMIGAAAALFIYRRKNSAKEK